MDVYDSLTKEAIEKKYKGFTTEQLEAVLEGSREAFLLSQSEQDAVECEIIMDLISKRKSETE